MHQLVTFYFRAIGPVIVAVTCFITLRLISPWSSFLLHWRRYRRREVVTTHDLRTIPVPFVKVQITTRGSAGSTEVISRSVRVLEETVAEDPEFYRRFLSVEVVTQNLEQAELFERRFADSAVAFEVLYVPTDYVTPRGTELKARGLHYAVERRREGWNRKDGRTFIVHFDEESVMLPEEFRKLVSVLATTDRKILEGPIYYPLEYLDASVMCRAMEANRPVGCFECRKVMEEGVPLHLHGSNLVIEEAFENAQGWDIGLLEGAPLIAEDYVFGSRAFLTHGTGVFGWHGCVLLEQPPFSVTSAFRQRHRWVFGVLQGLNLARRSPEFAALDVGLRRRYLWGTRYRVASFALGSIVGGLSLLFMPLVLIYNLVRLAHGEPPPLSIPITTAMGICGALWFGSVFIGAWCNVQYAGMTRERRIAEIARVMVSAPISGIIESSAGLWAVVQWNAGQRTINWQPTPKTIAADRAVDWSAPV